MGFFGGIGKAVGGLGKALVGQGGGGNKGGMVKQALQTKGIGPSAPAQQEMAPPVEGPMGQTAQGPPQQFNDGPSAGGWNSPQMGGFMDRIMQMPGMQERVQREGMPPPGYNWQADPNAAMNMGQNPQKPVGFGAKPYMSVPQGQFSSGQVGQGGGMQRTPPFAGPTSAMGRGAQKMGQMGLGPSPQMGMNRQQMPQMGQGTGGRMGQMRPNVPLVAGGPRRPGFTGQG